MAILSGPGLGLYFSRGTKKYIIGMEGSSVNAEISVARAGSGKIRLLLKSSIEIGLGAPQTVRMTFAI